MNKLLKVIFNHILITIGDSLPRHAFFNRQRHFFYRLAGMHIGKRVIIKGPLGVDAITTDRIFIGDGSFLNSEVRFGCRDGFGAHDDYVKIGNECQIGPRVSFDTGSHNLFYEEGIGRGTFTKPIVLKDKVWICTGALILQGVTINEGAVVAAGAVVNKDVEAYTVVAGVPAKKIKDIEHK